MSDNYFYSHESDLFTFYRVPKELILQEKYKNISTDAKLAYGILLDRNSLSQMNEWIDEQYRVFIYFTRLELQQTLNISDKTATKIFKELASVDLIEEKSQGKNRPNIIYVKKFITNSSSQPTRKIYESLPVKNTIPNTEKLTTHEPKNLRTSYNYYNNTYPSKKELVSNQEKIKRIENKEELTNEQFFDLNNIFNNIDFNKYTTQETEYIKETVSQLVNNELLIKQTGKSPSQLMFLINTLNAEMLERATSKFGIASKKKNIENPRLYLARCIISAIEEYGAYSLEKKVANKNQGSSDYSKLDNRNNFESRKYTDEEYANFFDNNKFFKNVK